jgi:hypothetical protein
VSRKIQSLGQTHRRGGHHQTIRGHGPWSSVDLVKNNRIITVTVDEVVDIVENVSPMVVIGEATIEPLIFYMYKPFFVHPM